jgi:hypothetical protein
METFVVVITILLFMSMLINCVSTLVDDGWSRVQSFISFLITSGLFAWGCVVLAYG